jgi:hypothetical protein
MKVKEHLKELDERIVTKKTQISYLFCKCNINYSKYIILFNLAFRHLLDLGCEESTMVMLENTCCFQQVMMHNLDCLESSYQHLQENKLDLLVNNQKHVGSSLDWLVSMQGSTGSNLVNEEKHVVPILVNKQDLLASMLDLLENRQDWWVNNLVKLESMKDWLVNKRDSLVSTLDLLVNKQDLWVNNLEKLVYKLDWLASMQGLLVNKLDLMVSILQMDSMENSLVNALDLTHQMVIVDKVRNHQRHCMEMEQLVRKQHQHHKEC